MRSIRVVLVAMLALQSLGAASAATLTFASYGSTNSAPAGVNNTATHYAGGPSYNVPTAGVWYGPLGNSSWVSDNPDDYPGGGAYPSNGIYDFTTTFFDATPGTSSGTITVLADDTTSVYLNGTLIVAAAPPGGTICDSMTPTCTTPATYNLTGFVAGINTMSFDVAQQGGGSMGVDFVGAVNTSTTVAPTPEPSSIVLLGTGALAMFGAARRRFA